MERQGGEVGEVAEVYRNMEGEREGERERRRECHIIKRIHVFTY